MRLTIPLIFVLFVGYALARFFPKPGQFIGLP